MGQPTTTQRLADAVLGGQLREFVLTRRAEGQSWRRVAICLLQEHDVDVSAETLRGWFKAASTEDAA